VFVPSVRLFAIVLGTVTPPLAAQSTPAVTPFIVESTTELDLGKTIASAPKWSPDGRWIAFSLPKGDGIGLVKPDGSGLRTLTAEPRSGYRFQWSPDGTRMAFRATAAKRAARNYVIRVADVANGEVETTSEVLPEVQPPEWQTGPEGMRWVSHGKNGIAEGTWTPTPARKDKVGPPLIVQQKKELWIYNHDARKKDKLSGVFGLNPNWNSARTAVVFDAQDRIAISTPWNGAPTRELCVGQHPAWSPDGQWIVYQITRDHSHAPDDPRQHTADTAPHRHDDKTNHQIVDSDLWLISIDGTQRQQLTNTADILEVDPDWSPDGTTIVCRDERTGRLRLLKVRRP
jgi:dipeptidyl aminopeptidase/acylaminoacyl peptidase